MCKSVFPRDFVWGVAASAYQIEGAWNAEGRGESIWDRFSHTPGKTWNGDSGDTACDHYHRYVEDVAFMRKLGVKAYRFSTSWPRILPKGKGDVNSAGLDFYKRLIEELLQAGIEPWLCLHHWDLPQTIQDEGGWTNPACIRYFSDYARLLAHELGDKVKRWIIFNEPRCIAWLGYLAGIHAPGKKDIHSAIKVSHHLLLAQGRAIQALKDFDHRFDVGTVLDLNVVHPIVDGKKDQGSADKYDQFWNRWFIDPLFKGEYPPLAAKTSLKPSKDDMNAIKQPLDFLGVNYYTRIIVAHDASVPLTEARAVQKKTPTTEMGWEIYPEGLYEVLMRFRTEYGNPRLYVTENGAAFEDKVTRNGQVQDNDRTSYLRDHIVFAHRALKDGANLKGYFTWTLMDNFEWAEGYSKLFGLIRTDRQTLKRTPKKSFYWYRDVITSNGITF